MPEDQFLEKPTHYREGTYAPYKIMEAYYGISPHLANALKYILRCDASGKREQDLRKALGYLKRAHECVKIELEGIKKKSPADESTERTLTITSQGAGNGNN